MKVSSWKSAVGAAGGILSIAVLLSATASPPRPYSMPAEAQEVTLEVDPAQSKVHYVVDTTLHTVHGTFSLKKGSGVHFDPETGKASGEVAVYATSGESGNSSRDERMHKEILETAKYPDAIFRPSQIEGKVALHGPSDVKLHGVLLLHGGQHEIVALVHAELTGDQWKGTAKFDVPYIQWGIRDPSNWLLKVKPVVNIELDMIGPATGVK
jgi:polyisoprenoid-binding protein YceI